MSPAASGHQTGKRSPLFFEKTPGEGTRTSSSQPTRDDLWTQPRELPIHLTGDRHAATYCEDGRLFITFRCNSPKQSAEVRRFEGDWVGWVGTWEDLVRNRPGQYFVRIKDNTKGHDTAYPGVELLPDDTIVTTTSGHWEIGEQPYIIAARFSLATLDALSQSQ